MIEREDDQGASALGLKIWPKENKEGKSHDK
jgi:hypothetical protein